MRALKQVDASFNRPEVVAMSDDQGFDALERAIGKSLEASDLEVASGGRSYGPIVRRWWDRLRGYARPRIGTPPTVPDRYEWR